MIAVVSGAGGFCGRAMVAFLLRKGVKVLQLHRSDFICDEHHLTRSDALLLARRFRETNIDYVFHLAGQAASAPHTELVSANLYSAITLFSALRLSGQNPVVLLMGSAAEYGNVLPSDLPLHESRRENPSGAYGMSKTMQTRVGEMAIAAGHRVILTRPFNIVGPFMPTSLALGNFLHQLETQRNNSTCTLRTGDLTPSRDFVHVDDAVRAWWDLANAPDAIGRLVNLCSGVPIGLSQVVDWLVAAAPAPVNVVSTPEIGRKGECQQIFGAPDLLKALIGWIPTPLTALAVRSITETHLAQECSS